MSFQNSPSLETYKNGYKPPEDPQKKTKRIRIIMGVLIAACLMLAGVLLVKGDFPMPFLGKGTITGYGVDEDGQPIQVEVLIFNTELYTTSDENGYFEIKDVPAGNQSIIVAQGEIASEVEVVVLSQMNNELGEVMVPTELGYLTEE